MKIIMKDAVTVLEGTPNELAEYLARLQGKYVGDLVKKAEQMFKGNNSDATRRTDS